VYDILHSLPYIIELVQVTEYAIKTCHQPLIPIYCNQWVRQVGVLSPYLFAVYLDELSDQPEWDALWEIWLWTICLLMICVQSKY